MMAPKCERPVCYHRIAPGTRRPDRAGYLQDVHREALVSGGLRFGVDLCDIVRDLEPSGAVIGIAVYINWRVIA